MAYRNNYNNGGGYNGGGYNGSKYNGGGYNGGGYNGGGYRSNGGNYPPKKPSGCKQGVTRDGEMYVYGWMKLGRSGVMIASAFMDNGKNRKIEGTSDSGKRWMRMLVSVSSGINITDARSKRSELHGGFYYPDAGHIIIPSMGIMLKPKSDYMGRVAKK